MANDLISVSADGAKHLLSVEDEDENQHLAVIRQLTAWTNKVFVAAPVARRFVTAVGRGTESYRNGQANAAVANDTLQLINAANARLAEATVNSWADGRKALYSCYARSHAPFCIYDAIRRGNVTTTDENYSAFDTSVLALQFNLRHLPLNRLTFTAYLRVHVMSFLLSSPADVGGHGITAKPPTFPTLDVRASKELVAPLATVDADSIALPAESLNVSGAINNGLVTTEETTVLALHYDPYAIYDTDDAGELLACPTRVYAGSGSSPADYYADIEMTGTLRAFLTKWSGKFWLLLRFAPVNIFSQPTTYGLAPGVGALVYAQRFAIVLKCSGTKFNA